MRPISIRYWNTIIFIIAFGLSGLAQIHIPFSVEGFIYDESGAPFPYASIVNQSTHKGTISNEAGYFHINALSSKDSLLFTFIGYEKLIIRAGDKERLRKIVLVASSQLLKEITVRAEDQQYLYRLIQDCKKYAPKETKTSKAYYELSSFVDGEQTELVECFYNATTDGYSLSRLDMKAGRFAIQKKKDRFFTSIDASASLRQFDIFSKTNHLPQNPFSLSLPASKRHYYLDLVKTYLDEHRDSIVVIRAVPRDTSGTFFQTIAEINASTKVLRRLQLYCKGAIATPFRPLFTTDSFQHVTMNINLTFKGERKKPSLHHIDFRYTILYESRDTVSYPVTAKAVLYCYDYGDPFNLPRFTFSHKEIGDYRRMNVIPYQDGFWQHQDFQQNDQGNRNKEFYTDTVSITNVIAYQPNAVFWKGIFQHPYVFWSTNRIQMKEAITDTLPTSMQAADVNALKYNISAKLYLDVNHWNDTLHVLTRAVMDPYETYYRLPMDVAAQCCINMYFDLVEIERRLLEKEILESDGREETIDELYKARVAHLEEMKLSFFGSVNRGQDQAAMEQANAVIVAMLGINNIGLFGMFKDKE